VVRDPVTGLFFRQSNGKYLPVIEEAMKLPTRPEHVSSNHQLEHGRKVARRETVIYWSATASMLASCVLPVYLHYDTAMNPHSAIVAVSATVLAMPVLAFSRRYLHGEFMFGRFASLCTGLLLGFNLVATAPDLEQALNGWSLFGFSSAFLIGAYNNRPTVRNNATFAFAAYRISDFAMLVAVTFSAHQAATTGNHPGLAAAAILVAALMKSSQFPLAALFLRSMEGPTPASALGYAGLSAHVGVVLLASTMPLWYPFEAARLALGSIGMFTAVYSSMVAKIRSDRKGSIARATSATLGLIFVTLALGHPNVALLMSLGHASFRMIQIMRAPNIIADTQVLRAALGRMPWPKLVPDWLYHLTWSLRRIDTDFHLLSMLHWISKPLDMSKKWKPTKAQQWLATSVSVVLAGLPFTPVSHHLDAWLMELLPTNPYLAGAVMFGHFTFSVVLIRFLLLNVLNTHRFRPWFHKSIGSSVKKQ